MKLVRPCIRDARGRGHERTEAIRRFREYMNVEIHKTCLEDELRQRKTDGEATAEIKTILKG